MEDTQLGQDGGKDMYRTTPQRMRKFDRFDIAEGEDGLEESHKSADLCREVLTRLRRSWGPLQR
jgi:hypothetical protein